MKSELLVIADQHAAVNTFSGLVHTACQVTEVGPAQRSRPQVFSYAENIEGGNYGRAGDQG